MGLRQSRQVNSLGSGGAKRDRTDDLYNAIVALSQLSYSPTRLETGPVLTCNTGFVEAYFRKQASKVKGARVVSASPAF